MSASLLMWDYVKHWRISRRISCRATWSMNPYVEEDSDLVWKQQLHVSLKVKALLQFPYRLFSPQRNLPNASFCSLLALGLKLSFLPCTGLVCPIETFSGPWLVSGVGSGGVFSAPVISYALWPRGHLWRTLWRWCQIVQKLGVPQVASQFREGSSRYFKHYFSTSLHAFKRSLCLCTEICSTCTSIHPSPPCPPIPVHRHGDTGAYLATIIKIW